MQHGSASALPWPGDQPGATMPGDVGPGPLEQHQEAVAEADQERDVDEKPGEPRDRSEEHTSELQSLTNLVCRLLLEKKKVPQTFRRFRNFEPRRPCRIRERSWQSRRPTSRSIATRKNAERRGSREQLPTPAPSLPAI